MGELFGRDKPKHALAWTGERLTDGAGMQVELEHLHRYFLARELARDLDVLDVASGEGYGAALLAQTARSVVGVDIDPDAVAHAGQAYPRSNLRFVTGDARRLPLGDACVDLVVSFETIEHLGEHDEMLLEVRRVLRPDGRLLVSTPERDNYSPSDMPANPFHVRELTRAEFAALLERHFAHVSLVGQRPVLGSAIFPEQSESLGGLLTFERRGDERFEASLGLPRAVYLLALASARELSVLPGSLYIQAATVEAAVAEGLRHESGKLADSLEAERLAARTQIDSLTRQAELDRSAAQAERRELVEQQQSRDAATESRLRELLSRVEQLGEALRTLAQTRKAEQAILRERLREADQRQARSRGPVGGAPRGDPPVSILENHRRHAEREFAKAVTALTEASDYARHLERELAAQNRRADHLNAQLQAVLASTSWQITGPLRRSSWIGPFARRGVRGIAAALPWVKRRDPPAPPPADPIATVAAIPATVPEPPGKSQARDPDDFKAALREELSADLAEFLADSERIVFRTDEPPVISVLIVLWNKAHFTLRCLRSLQAQQAEVPLEIIIVDNASSDETGQLLERVDGAKILRNPTNEGFLLATNRAAEMATGKYLLLLNNDAFPRPGAISVALETLRSAPDIGAVGALLILPSGLVQEAGSLVWNDGSTYGFGRGMPPECGEVRFRRDVTYCSGAFLLTPRDRWEALRGFDEAFAPAYYEDTDYCMRLQEQGLRVVFEPGAIVDHYELGSQAKSGDAVEASLRNRGYFYERHSAMIERLPRPELHNALPARDQIAGRSKRLLIVDDLLPLRENGSGMPRLQAIITAAIKAGWSVTCYMMSDPEVDWEKLWTELPAGVEIIADRGPTALGDFLQERAGHYRAILVSRPHNMPAFWAAVGSHPRALGHARVIYDAEAIFTTREIVRNAIDGIKVDSTKADAMIADEIRRSAAGTHAVTCVSHEDHALFRRFLPPGIPAHRVGHAVAVARGTPPYAARRGFLFVGRLLEPSAPNWQGLAWFIREVWPEIRRTLPDAEMTVVGRLHPAHDELAAPGVRLLGPVNDLQPIYDGARVFVAPVRFAAGIPIKIVEATAAGLPTACTALMASQLGWPPGEALAASDDPAEMALRAVALHENGEPWQSMLDRAQACLSREFGQEAFEAALAAALGGGGEPVEETAGSETHRRSRIKAVWDAPPPETDQARWARLPTSHPVILGEMNRRASGSPDKSTYAALREFLAADGYDLPLAHAASLCSGNGAEERILLAEASSATASATTSQRVRSNGPGPGLGSWGSTAPSSTGCMTSRRRTSVRPASTWS